MDLKSRLDQVDAELSSPAAMAVLRSFLKERGAPADAEEFVVAFIKAALEVARSAVHAYSDALSAFWIAGKGIAGSIEGAYYTLALFANSTPAKTSAEQTAKHRCEAALRLINPYLTQPLKDIDAAGRPADGLKPMADWRHVSKLLKLPVGEEPLDSFLLDTITQELAKDEQPRVQDLPELSTGIFRGPASPAPAAPIAAPPPDVPLYDVWFGTNRKPVDAADLAKGFTNERDPKGDVHYGSCSVEVPRTHQFGSLGTPFLRRWLRLKFTDDHLKLRKIESFASGEEFIRELRDEMQAMSESERCVLVYLHGYNTSFENAALRAAQIGFDLKSSVTAFYSWPSMAQVKGYPADIARVEASEEQIADFLKAIAMKAGAVKVHVIAHSMGNRGFARAIARITSHAAATSGIRFGQIILAAPDLDVDLFKQLAVAYPKISERTTMYVSARDKALSMSSWLQDSNRAGFTPPVTVLDGIDTVEVTNIDLTLLGHGYFAEAEPVLYDIKDLIEDNKPPEKRLRVEAHADGSAKYWVIRA